MEKLSSGINTFIAFDIETTGFNSVKDRIIEIGAVKVVDGKIVESFDELVDPEITIPHKITRLTGISQSDVEGKPKIYEVLERFEIFIKGFPLVAHNVSFDKGFIDENFLRCYGRKVANIYFDTLIISRIVFPFAKSHKLPDLLVFIGYNPTVHRAYGDADGCAKLWMRLWEEAEKLSDSSIKDILSLINKVDWEYKDFLKDLFFSNKQKNIVNNKNPQDENKSRSETPVVTEKVENYFLPQGEISKVLNEFEYREEQKVMSKKVMEAFDNKDFLLVEAGTGIGKTLAYLIPAIHFAIKNNTGVIVSTNTINLQEQIIDKDIPLLKKIIDFDFKVTMLKGRNNYFCLNKYYGILKSPEKFLKEDDLLNLLTLSSWIHETKTGDISENRGFVMIKHKFLWSKIRCDEECMSRRCSYFHDCFLFNIREKAIHSHLVIVNHSLFFADRGYDCNILPEFKNYIFDEAHNLEKTASEHLGFTITKDDLLNGLEFLYENEKKKKEYGLLVNLKILLIANKNANEYLDEIECLIKKVIVLKKDINIFWTNFSSINKAGNGDLSIKKRLTSELEINKLVNINFDGFVDEFNFFTSLLKNLLNNLFCKFDEEKEIKNLLQGITTKLLDLEKLVDDFVFILDSADQENFVYWMEFADNRNEISLKVLPLNISEKMNILIYSHAETIIFSSATLAVENDFTYFRSRMGLYSKNKKINELLLSSPFDYKKQSILIIPDFIPLPSDSDFFNAVSSVLLETILKIRGKHLILFTSYIQLNFTYKAISNKLEDDKILVLAQGINGDRGAITNKFKEQNDSVLLGTQSFWEGVDFAGLGMKTLIIVKLPFPVPNEPLVEAHTEQIKKQGGDSFYDYMIPIAISKFRQGFGRLIRSKKDKGAVIVLDKRVVSTNYGKKFLKVLPVDNIRVNNQSELIDAVLKWS